MILAIEQFDALIEDIEDLTVIVDRRDEPTVSHEELLEELKCDVESCRIEW